MTIGSYSKETLKEREGFRATLTNIPSSAQETLLLRALQSTGAKTVYIPYNSNRNPGRIAKVFFKCKEDLNRALGRSIYYYNTRLQWKDISSYTQNRVDNEKAFTRSRSTFLPQEEKSVASSSSSREQKRNCTPITPLSQEENSDEIEDQTEKENNISTVLNKILSRLENLEEKVRSPQGMKGQKAPNRS
jgi:hypothetical protein